MRTVDHGAWARRVLILGAELSSGYHKWWRRYIESAVPRASTTSPEPITMSPSGSRPNWSEPPSSPSVGGFKHMPRRAPATA